MTLEHGGFSTQRLIMRPWQERDRPAFRQLNSDPEVMRYFPAILPAEQSDRLMDRWQEHIGRHGWGFWAVERTFDGVLVGAVGIGKVPFSAPFVPAVEIGWRLLPSYWRRGYALEAAIRALEVGFLQVGLTQIVAFTLPGNQPSRRLMERLGMRRDPGDDFPHPSLDEGHPMRRHVLYRLQRSAWRRRVRLLAPSASAGKVGGLEAIPRQSRSIA